MEAPDILIDPRIADGSNPVMFAYRSPDNKLFLLGEMSMDDPEELSSDYPFHELLDRDASLSEIEDLPIGYRAYRKKKDGKWDITKLKSKGYQGDYLDGHMEWMNKMYVDGYFTGGRVPHWYTYPGRPRLFGWVSMLIGFVILGVTFVVSYLNKGEVIDNPLGPAILGLFFLLIGGSILLRKRS